MDNACSVVGEDIKEAVGKPIFMPKEDKGKQRGFELLGVASHTAMYVLRKDLRGFGKTESDIEITKETIVIQPYNGDLGEGFTAHTHIYYKVK